MRQLLTIKQVKERLSVSGPTIYRLADEGLLPAVEIAKRQRKRLLRWREETLEKFIASREQRGSK